MTTETYNETSKTSAEIRQAGRDLRDTAAEEARGVRDAASEHIQKQAESARDGIADEVGSVGRALRSASSELRDGSPQEQIFSTAANALADFSDTMRGKDLGQMLSEVNDFGRRNPMAFLGGAALLGFAGMRLARASYRSPSSPSAPAPATIPSTPSVSPTTSTPSTSPAAPPASGVGLATPPTTPATGNPSTSTISPSPSTGAAHTPYGRTDK
ncbi:hypothetical protein [Tropicimonas isoalkanivorans]|uniref:Uncharacterized protein n=1 Tax=Tropicimonas isoalkanivorans TaxID=441112 RepID=A0A1I1EF22_9RHOB|nr:hypothetical protein [Tropicimonas isoalkanivorans]SFB85162.1 hypothetical protein SAMN04488094_101764 [Tropicimonas isoalkanivorans]